MSARAPTQPFSISHRQPVRSSGSRPLHPRARRSSSTACGRSTACATKSLFVSHRRRLVGLAADYRLPVLYSRRDFAEAGGLMSYSIDQDELTRRVVARFVDRILRGARPADLPVEQPTSFELVINLKTARALGLIIPQALRLRANQLLE